MRVCCVTYNLVPVRNDIVIALCIFSTLSDEDYDVFGLTKRIREIGEKVKLYSNDYFNLYSSCILL